MGTFLTTPEQKGFFILFDLHETAYTKPHKGVLLSVNGGTAALVLSPSSTLKITPISDKWRVTAIFKGSYYGLYLSHGGKDVADFIHPCFEHAVASAMSYLMGKEGNSDVCC